MLDLELPCSPLQGPHHRAHNFLQESPNWQSALVVDVNLQLQFLWEDFQRKTDGGLSVQLQPRLQGQLPLRSTNVRERTNMASVADKNCPGQPLLYKLAEKLNGNVEDMGSATDNASVENTQLVLRRSAVADLLHSTCFHPMQRTRSSCHAQHLRRVLVCGSNTFQNSSCSFCGLLYQRSRFSLWIPSHPGRELDRLLLVIRTWWMHILCWIRCGLARPCFLSPCQSLENTLSARFPSSPEKILSQKFAFQYLNRP